MTARRVLIMGAAGRDFHNFNLCYRDNRAFEVVGFTATQIPNISGRRYPAPLAGSLYPDGIPIYEEDRIEELIRTQSVDLVVFAYSDVSHAHVMHKGSQVVAAGADFVLLGFDATSLKSKKPVVSVCAVRTGAGKSQTTRRVCRKLLDQIEELIRTQSVDLVVFAYSDVSHAHVMHKGSQVVAAGADFVLLGFDATSLKSKKPVVSVCAVRTGAGKSQTTRRVCRKLLD